MPKNSTIYTKAPIILAIIQLRYEKLENFDTKKIREIGQGIKKEFEFISDNVTQNIKLDPKAETKVSIDKSEINGVVFESSDKKKVLDVGTQRFSLELKESEYPGWESFSSELKKYWGLFSKHFGEIKLVGLSARFINKINLPNERFLLNKYFNTYIHNNSDADISGFNMTYQTFKGKNLANITHTLGQPIDNHIPYFLDIDVIRLEKIESDEKVIWEVFDNIRQEKNSIFDNTLTEETKNLIK